MKRRKFTKRAGPFGLLWRRVLDFGTNVRFGSKAAVADGPKYGPLYGSNQTQIPQMSA